LRRHWGEESVFGIHRRTETGAANCSATTKTLLQIEDAFPVSHRCNLARGVKIARLAAFRQGFRFHLSRQPPKKGCLKPAWTASLQSGNASLRGQITSPTHDCRKLSSPSRKKRFLFRNGKTGYMILPSPSERGAFGPSSRKRFGAGSRMDAGQLPGGGTEK